MKLASLGVSMGGLWYHTGLRALRVPTLARLRDRALILCYHNVVRDDAAPTGDASLHCPLDRFTRHMEWLDAHYDCLPLEEVVVRLESGRALRGIASITFDDAYAGVFAHALPVLRALDLTATVFPVAGACEARTPFWWDEVAGAPPRATRVRWLEDLRGDGAAISATAVLAERAPSDDLLPADWCTIRRAAAAGVALGAHTVTHRSLPCLSDDDLGFELEVGRDRIAAHTGVRPRCFAYPYGLWDPRVRSAVRAAGYRAALTLDYGSNGPGQDLWALKRISVPAGISLAAFETWSAGLRPWRR
jgi:peptidoglycan/xylan/chitin deacetylase (PgdA/CDA1 family)